MKYELESLPDENTNESRYQHYEVVDKGKSLMSGKLPTHFILFISNKTCLKERILK